MEGMRAAGVAPDAVGGEAGVELEGALLGEGLDCAVDGALVGQRAIGQRLHLLDARLHKVKRQRAGSREEAGNCRAAQNDRLAVLLEARSLQHLLSLSGDTDHNNALATSKILRERKEAPAADARSFDPCRAGYTHLAWPVDENLRVDPCTTTFNP